MKLSIADILQVKYGLYSSAADLDNRAARLIADLKQGIKDTYTNIINNRRDNTITYFAGMGDKSLQKIIRNFEIMLENLDDLSVEELFKILNKTLETVSFILKDDPSRETMNAIWDSVVIRTQADKNRRANLKRTFEGNLSRLSSILEKQLIALKKISLTDQEIKGTAIEPVRKELPAKAFYDFTFTPEAEKLGLSDLKIMEEILKDSDSKRDLTTLINALKRGHSPRDWNVIQEEANRLINKHKDSSFLDNSKLFEEDE